MITRSQDLTTSLSTDPLCVAGALVSKKFIQSEVLAKVVINDTPIGKAAILVEAVRNEIDVAPVKFIEFLEILSEQSWAKEVVESLRSTYQSESVMISHDFSIHHACTCRCHRKAN